MIVYNDIYGSLIGKTQQGLNISVSGMSLTISAGNINNISLPDTTINFSSPANDRQVEISLVKKLVDGTGDIWVDNRIFGRNRSNVPAGYELIEILCWFKLPAGITDLNNTDINVRRII